MPTGGFAARKASSGQPCSWRRRSGRAGSATGAMSILRTGRR